MIQEIENLKKLVLEGGFDEASKQEVENLQKRVQLAIMAEKLKDHQIITDIISYLNDEIKRCSTVLAHDRKQTELQREVLFEKRELCKQLLAFFSPSDIVNLEEEIKSLLNVAKSQI